MGNIESAGRNITIGAIHGFGQTPEHWDLLRPLLAARGIGMVAVDLPAGDPNATYNDYAAVAAEAFRPAVENGDHFFLLAHSMGSQVVPGTVRRLRRFGRDAVSGAIDLSGSVGRSSNDVADLATRLVPQIPQQRNTDEFREAILPLTNGLSILNPAKTRQLLFNACDVRTFDQALQHTRPAGRPQDEPSEEEQRIPGLKRTYAVGDQDNVRRGAERTAHNIGATLVRMSGDHSLAVSNPEGVADLIVDFVGRVIAGSNFETSPQPSAVIAQPSFGRPAGV